jgi:hypothetical protein
MAKRRPKAAAEKPLTYEFLPSNSEIGKPIYERLYAIVDAHHEEISHAGAKIALCWATSWKADVDGRLKLGECRKASDLDREMHPFDFVILLNRNFWMDTRVTDAQRAALLDHELCHCGIQHDAETGEIKTDARGRVLYRIVKHDIEEFAEVVARNGCYKADLEHFARAIVRAEKLAGDGWISYTAVHETLKQIGIDIPPTRIAEWPEAERRSIHTWALIRLDVGDTVNLATSQTIPELLVEAIAAKRAGESAAPDVPPAEVH